MGGVLTAAITGSTVQDQHLQNFKINLIMLCELAKGLAKGRVRESVDQRTMFFVGRVRRTTLRSKLRSAEYSLQAGAPCNADMHSVQLFLSQL